MLKQKNKVVIHPRYGISTVSLVVWKMEGIPHAKFNYPSESDSFSLILSISYVFVKSSDNMIGNACHALKLCYSIILEMLYWIY